MKTLSLEQTRELARVVLSTVPDELTCDEWLDHAAAYAELLSAGASVPEPLRRLAQHLQVCPDCMAEIRVWLRVIAEESEAGS